jgi:hypothetical protein
MKRWMKVAAPSLVALLALGYGSFRYMRGPSGASVAYGGALEAKVVPEFTSTDASTWANGDATSLASLRGAPVILEIWSPT